MNAINKKIIWLRVKSKIECLLKTLGFKFITFESSNPEDLYATITSENTNAIFEVSDRGVLMVIHYEQGYFNNNISIDLNWDDLEISEDKLGMIKFYIKNNQILCFNCTTNSIKLANTNMSNITNIYSSMTIGK